MKFSIIHASARPEEWEKSALTYFDNSSGKHAIEYILVTEPSVNGFSDNATDEQFNNLYDLFPSLSFYVLRGTTPKSSVAHWNLGAAKATGDIIILNSDDMFPPKDWDEKLAEAITDQVGELEDKFVIRVGYKEESQPGLMTLQVMTKAYYDYMGYAMYPGYQSVYADKDFTSCAEELGVVIEAPEIVWEHRHPIFTGKEFDDTYKTENETQRYLYGKELFEFRKKLGYQAILGFEPFKKNFEPIKPISANRIVALGYPGDNFSSEWVTDWSQLIGYCFAKNIGSILCPAKGNSTHIIRNNQIVEAEGSGVDYDYFWSIDSDQTNAHSAFVSMFENMESRPDIDILAGWTFMTSGNVNCGNFIYNSEGQIVKDENQVYEFNHLSLEEISKAKGPIELGWVGFGCVMIRRKVIQAIGPGLFNAVYKGGWLSDDEGFCLRALDKGFKVYVDPKAYVPHWKLQPLKFDRKEKALGNCNYSGNS